MPNHVTSRCTVTGPAEDIVALRAQIFSLDEDQNLFFDFDKIIPMPVMLRKVEESNVSKQGAALIKLRADCNSHAPFAFGELYDFEVKRIRADVEMPTEHIQAVAKAYLTKHPEFEIKGAQRLQAILETGFASWYPWALENWGTKWGAYDFELLSDEPLLFKFETAWSFPIPVFTTLAYAFPSLKFDCVTYDDGANFAGRGFFNPAPGDEPFDLCDATDELYELAYGCKPERDEDDAE